MVVNVIKYLQLYQTNSEQRIGVPEALEHTNKNIRPKKFAKPQKLSNRLKLVYPVHCKNMELLMYISEYLHLCIRDLEQSAATYGISFM